MGAALALAGCNNPPPAGNDGGGTGTDTGVVTDTGAGLRCPSGGTNPPPNPDEQQLPCCYRVSQADHLDMPELRLRYLNLTAPTGAALVNPVVRGVLNASLTTEVFNWLIRGESGTGDGPVTIQTGFGSRDAATGTYAFSTETRYLPVTLQGTITGETVTTSADPGVLVVPIFDPTGTMLQVELSLHNVQVVTSTFSENRSCIGTLAARGAFDTAATLSAYLTVEDTRGSMINVDPIHSELCTLVAGSGLADPASGPYCDQPQAMWQVQPNALCPATGPCMLNDAANTVCHPDGTGTACNAWQLVADFAAVGVEITP